MEESISWFIGYLSMYSIAMPALVGLLFYKRLQAVQKTLLILILLSTLIEIIALWVIHQGGYQHLVYRIFTILEFSLLTYIFAQGIKPFFTEFFFKGAVIFFFLFVLADMIWISGIVQFNSYSTAIEGLILIFFSLIFFYKTLQELQIQHLEREPLFWISTGVLLYFASSLFIFLFTNYINSSTRSLFIIWGIHGIFSILLNIFYSIALWVKPSPSILP